MMIPLMHQENRRLDQNEDEDKNYRGQRGHGRYSTQIGFSIRKWCLLVSSLSRQEPFAK